MFCNFLSLVKITKEDIAGNAILKNHLNTHVHELAQTAVILKLFSVSAESLTYNF